MDIYKEITERIITEMEKGIIPWEKPWIASGNCVAHTTGKPYSLLNQMLLGRPGEYITFNQCQKEGGRVKKGEKSHMVVFWKWIEQEDEETGEKKEIPFLRYYNVFHIDQCEGISAKHTKTLHILAIFKNNSILLQSKFTDSLGEMPYPQILPWLHIICIAWLSKAFTPTASTTASTPSGNSVRTS